MTSAKTSPDSAQAKEVQDLTAGIERTRSEMSATLGAIEQRFSPAELGVQAKLQLDHIELRVKALMKEGLAETKQVLAEQIETAKGAVRDQLHEARDLVAHGLSDARQALKDDINTSIAATKKSIRDATIGRVEQLATQAGDVMNETKNTIIETVRQNPIPAAMAGIGIVWLFMNRSARIRGLASDLAEGVTHAVHAAGSALGTAGSAIAGAAHDASDVTGRAVHGAAEAAGELGVNATHALTTVASTARERAMRAERGIATTFESNPIAMGAAALAAGAAVGYALPRTTREDALFEGVRDQVVHGATDLAHDAAHTLHHLADRAGDNVRQAIAAATK